MLAFDIEPACRRVAGLDKVGEAMSHEGYSGDLPIFALIIILLITLPSELIMWIKEKEIDA